MIKRIRKAWKEYFNASEKLARADLELYVQQAKNYLTTTRPGMNGLCYYADKSMGDIGEISAYSLWSVLSAVKGSVAAKWQAELDRGVHPGGRHPARIAMVKALIAELEQVIQKDKAHKR